jgi:CRP-like cAMP-binding protein
MSTMTFWLHTGNVLYLLAYLVRDILWLRILTVVASLSLIVFYFSRDLYAAITWCSLFTLVNLVQIAMLILERRPVFLGEDEMRLYHKLFRTLTPREFMKLLSIAQWKSAGEGEEILKQGEAVTELNLISSGMGVVAIDGRHIAEVGPNQFVGEMAFLTEQDASASVVAQLPLGYLAWPVDQLRTLFHDAPQIHVKFQGVLGSDLVEKLRHEGISAAHPSQIINSYQTEEAE